MKIKGPLFYAINGGGVIELEEPQRVMVEQQEGNGLAVAGLVLGIIGVVLNIIPFIPYILGVLAVIFGIVGLNKQVKRGMANFRHHNDSIKISLLDRRNFFRYGRKCVEVGDTTLFLDIENCKRHNDDNTNTS
ncbi:hypothetical protein SAMN04487943_10982 [Gracilibacillus orientalis]|uniref:Uncharacterized protein n=1 Tax=Gracilibacillus orientalis TaxID=334253 RepID=A0A1I4NRH4_9BACI|nr:DUF4190 domain-containing protein [Gracilibacillus orientalis]SFM17753.1 hypothetical protein SAMN04487943_10982 [Gracilibacillus orientalis]